MSLYNVIIIGAGAAGLMCAIEAGKRGRSVLLIDHAKDPGEKIRISGGGRCNFTNIYTQPQHFISENPRFCISALKRFTPGDFIELVKKHNIAYHEKTLGQLFCDSSSKQIINMLLLECQQAGVTIRLSTSIESVQKNGDQYKVTTSGGVFLASSLVISTGGLSIPKMGATGLGYEIATQFGLPIIPTRAGLVPFTFNEPLLTKIKNLAGVSAPIEARCSKQRFKEAFLCTHRGLSGPAILQISSYWQPGEIVHIRFAPGEDLLSILKNARDQHPKQDILSILTPHLPKRLLQEFFLEAGGSKKMADFSNATLEKIASSLMDWKIIPGGTEGYKTAEVTLGGVDTKSLSSQTFECNNVPGLYFIGEVVDVTGHLGGFNFQWAWASGYVAGQYA
jgi:predicted Rossmann fold flavoprotein